MRYGYARVSSKAQDYTAQVEALKAAGCERIFSEKASGKSTDGRPEFNKLLKALLPGDTIVVTKLDRLARSSRDLHNILVPSVSMTARSVSLPTATARARLSPSLPKNTALVSARFGGRFNPKPSKRRRSK
jgi:DNA invertase Pin-like site-specific DNA recombinase